MILLSFSYRLEKIVSVLISALTVLCFNRPINSTFFIFRNHLQFVAVLIQVFEISHINFEESNKLFASFRVRNEAMFTNISLGENEISIPFQKQQDRIRIKRANVKLRIRKTRANKNSNLLHFHCTVLCSCFVHHFWP